MTDYMHLIGAEEVSRAGRSISEAGSEMLRAASFIDESLRQNQRFMDDWLMRFQQVLEVKP